MNKLRVGSKTRYDIEVNDNGDIISLDPNDAEFMLKYAKLLSKVKTMDKELKALNELPDDTDQLEEGEIFSENTMKIAEGISNWYKATREAFDEFLGKGACQKIFGDVNYLNMFNDLLDELEPHLKAMGIKNEKFKEEIITKYSDKEEDVL